MSCSHNFSGNAFPHPRAILCQSEKLAVDTNCSSPNFYWVPGGFFTQEVDLQVEVTHEVVVGCDSCGDDQVLEYCIPVIKPSCTNPSGGPLNPYEIPPAPTGGYFYFTCDSGNSDTVTDQGFDEDYVCAGDPIDWSTVEFDYSHVPTGITAAYGGTGANISVTVDFAFLYPGTYHLPTRVKSTSGKYSNWALLPIYVDFGNCCS